jgi:hypothetical protein
MKLAYESRAPQVGPDAAVLEPSARFRVEADLADVADHRRG